MHIVEDDLSGSAIRGLLEIHFAGMLAASPEGTCHFLDFEGLKSNDVTFWSVWHDDELAGCGALKDLGGGHGEIKSMRVTLPYIGKGAGHAMLQHIIVEAKQRNYHRLSLETGVGAEFEAAHRLYNRAGFSKCGPFADYEATPFNHYMTMEL